MIWLGLVLCHIKSTIVDYLMSNPHYTHISNMYMICKLKSTKLNGSKYCYVSLTIQLSISHLFTQLNIQTVLFVNSWNFKQLYLTHRKNLIRCYHTSPGWNWKWCKWSGTPHSSKLQYYSSFATSLMSYPG